MYEKALYKSIPSESRPELNTTDAGTTVTLSVIGGTMTAIGSTFLPFTLKTLEDEKVRLVLHTYVVPNLLMGMFLGTSKPGFGISSQWGPAQGPIFGFDFGSEICRFQGI